MSAAGDETAQTGLGVWRRRLRTSAFWYAILGCYLGVLGFLSLNPWLRPESTASPLSPDKLEHALAYGGLSVIVYFCLRTARGAQWRGASAAWLAALGLATLIGVLIEVAQSLFTTNRTGSVEDAAANAIGAICGFIAFQTVKYVYARSITTNRQCHPRSH